MRNNDNNEEIIMKKNDELAAFFLALFKRCFRRINTCIL